MNNASGEPWIPWTTKADWEFIDNSLYFKHQLYIPEPAQFDLIKSLHESPARGHECFFHMLHRMQQDYWWPGMSTFLCKFISGCANCQTAKVNSHLIVPGLSPLAVETPIPFPSILVDLITGLPDSHSFDSVMVVVDHGLTKGGNLLPLHKKHRRCRSCPTLFCPCFPVIWPSLQGDLWQRTTICLCFHQRARSSTPIWCYTLHCLPSTNGQRNWKSKSGIGNLLEAVLLKQTWRMVYVAPYGRIRSQLCHPFRHPKDSILSHDGIQTLGIPFPWQDVPTQPRKSTLELICCSWRCPGRPQGCSTKDERMDNLQVHPLESRS